ncbi:unnamed protein product [Lampetra fluviatilis]
MRTLLSLGNQRNVILLITGERDNLTVHKLGQTNFYRVVQWPIQSPPPNIPSPLVETQHGQQTTVRFSFVDTPAPTARASSLLLLLLLFIPCSSELNIISTRMPLATTAAAAAAAAARGYAFKTSAQSEQGALRWMDLCLSAVGVTRTFACTSQADALN